MKAKLLLLAFSLYFNLLFSQNFQIDTSFGENGRIKLSFGEASVNLSSIEKLPNGKIILSGNMGGHRLVSLNQDGTLDTAFGTNGYAHDDSLLYNINSTLKILNNGQFLVVTSYDFFNSNNEFCENPVFLKFNSNGTLDTSFGTNGIQTYDFNCLNIEITNYFIDSNDNLIVLGNIADNNSQLKDFFVSKFNLNGQIDTAFGNNGILRINVGTQSDVSAQNIDILSSVKEMSNGDLIFGGTTRNSPITFTNSVLIKTNSNGQIDSSFGINGRIFINFEINTVTSSIEIINDSIFLIGSTGESIFFNSSFPLKIALAKLNSLGVLDITFGDNGKKVISDLEPFYHNSSLFSSVISNNKLNVVARSYKYQNGSLIRNGSVIRQFNLNGEVDTSFGSNGKIEYYYVTGPNDPDPNTETFSRATSNLQTSDGSLYLGGYFVPPSSFEEALVFLVKYSSSNLVSDSMFNSWFTISPNPFANHIEIQLPHEINSNIIIELIDIQGRKIESFFYSEAINNISIPIKDNLSNGNYFLKIMSDQKSEVHKLIKQ